MTLKLQESKNRNYLKETKPLVYEKIQKFDEKLKKGESIAIIQFQYNYDCNFRCQHCSIKTMQAKQKRRMFTIPDVRNLFRQADSLGLARVTITGGEPLIFKDFDELVAAIDPQKFYINSDTNGWFLDKERAKHLKAIGVDRIQLSLDSLKPEEHDAFRGMKGAFEKAMKAVDASLEAGLQIFIQTVVWKERLYSQEFQDFIKYFNNRGIGVFVSFAKPVGAWEGKFDNLIDQDDLKYFQKLEKKHQVFSHLTPAYGLNMGCIAVKGMISITQYGDVLPCPYVYISLGNVFDEPLKDIIEKGLKIKYFGERVETCTIAEDRNFIFNYLEKKVYGKTLPVPWFDVFSYEDRTQKPFNESKRLFNQ